MANGSGNLSPDTFCAVPLDRGSYSAWSVLFGMVWVSLSGLDGPISMLSACFDERVKSALFGGVVLDRVVVPAVDEGSEDAVRDADMIGE
jgi:hypothetical protein